MRFTPVLGARKGWKLYIDEGAGDVLKTSAASIQNGGVFSCLNSTEHFDPFCSRHERGLASEVAFI